MNGATIPFMSGRILSLVFSFKKPNRMKMSDEEKGLPEDEFQFSLPDWMTEGQVGYGEAGMLADDEGEFFERHRVDPTGHVVTAVPRRRYIYQKSIRAAGHTLRLEGGAVILLHGDSKPSLVPGSKQFRIP